VFCSGYRQRGADRIVCSRRWDGIEVERIDQSGPDVFQGAAVVVLPAWVENRPVRLLQALQCGIPVIASEACGPPAQANLTLVPAGDSKALLAALRLYARR